MSAPETCLIGIDPKTKEAKMGFRADDAEAMADAIAAGFIIVRTTPAKARVILFQVVPDVYEVAL